MKGGELGFMSRSQLVPEFANVAFALNDPKKVSNVVESEYGFHIIQLIERRGDMGNFRHILLKPRVPQESLDTALVRLDSIRSGIMQQKITFDEAEDYFYLEVLRDLFRKQALSETIYDKESDRINSKWYPE